MKNWSGPTPRITSGSIGPLMNVGFDMGFKAAMNSPEVRAMYEWLHLYVNFLDGGGEVPDTLKAMGVLATYEAGLKENDDDTKTLG